MSSKRSKKCRQKSKIPNQNRVDIPNKIDKYFT